MGSKAVGLLRISRLSRNSDRGPSAARPPIRSRKVGLGWLGLRGRLHHLRANIHASLGFSIGFSIGSNTHQRRVKGTPPLSSTSMQVVASLMDLDSVAPLHRSGK